MGATDEVEVPDNTHQCHFSVVMWLTPAHSQGLGDSPGPLPLRESPRGAGFPPMGLRAAGPGHPENGLVLGPDRLFSLFGLRVGADLTLCRSTTCDAEFVVNQGERSPRSLDGVRHLY